MTKYLNCICGCNLVQLQGYYNMKNSLKHIRL